MKVYFTDQSKHFPKHLEFFKRQPVMRYSKLKMTEKITVISLTGTKDIPELNTSFFLDYQIFPNSIMTYLTQWNAERREMLVGDTIVQQVFIPPFRHLSLKIIFGVRINEIICEPTKIGFSLRNIRRTR